MPPLLSLAVAAEAVCQFDPNPAVPAYSSITVSGQSAGASAALQHAVAFSSRTDGLLVAAGSPYGCGAADWHDWTCYYFGLSEADMVRYLRRRAEQDLIDDPRNLKDMPVLLFSGALDFVVFTGVMRSVQHQLGAFGVRPKRAFHTRASHVWSRDHGRCSCGQCALQSSSLECCDVNNCGYDLSGDMLRTFFGDRVQPRTETRRRGLRWIEQWKYLPRSAGPANASTLLRWAPAYVPESCEANLLLCAVHVNYHGCTPNPKKRGADRHSRTWADRLVWVNSIDINNYAEANRIVVLYPQAAGSDSIGEGCFNWASYEDDPLFDTRLGVQLNTVLGMLAALPEVLQHDGGYFESGEPPDPPTLGFRRNH